MVFQLFWLTFSHGAVCILGLHFAQELGFDGLGPKIVAGIALIAIGLVRLSLRLRRGGGYLLISRHESGGFRSTETLRLTKQQHSTRFQLCQLMEVVVIGCWAGYLFSAQAHA